MRSRTFALPAALPMLLLLAGALLLAACSGGDDETPTPGPDASGTTPPTATPFANVPDPIIVTGDGGPAGGGATETEATYTVVAGDTLGAIAERFGVSMEVIQQANDLDGVDIFIGQDLVIPRDGGTGGGGTSGSTGGDSGDTDSDDGGEATSTPTTPNGVDTYTVEDGDTAFGIALKFDTTVEALEEANDVEPGGLDSLQIGQVLRLPRP